jgi:hypothetical protein
MNDDFDYDDDWTSGVEPDDPSEGGEVEEIDVIPPALKAKLRKLVEMREDRDAKKIAWQKAKDDTEALELEIFDIFERPDANGDPQIKGTLSVPLGEPYGVVKFRTRETYYAKIVDEDEVQQYYEKRAMMEEVSAPKFVMKHLNGDVREALENNQNPPPGLTYTVNRGMTITQEK